METREGVKKKKRGGMREETERLGAAKERKERMERAKFKQRQRVKEGKRRE